MEEITTTTTYEDDSDSDGNNEAKQVPESETIVEPQIVGILNSPEINISQVEKGPAWEHNWLFKRKQQLKKVGSSKQPVSMLVPNPSETMPVMIGQDKADELSDDSDVEQQPEQEEDYEIDGSEEENPVVSEIGLVKVADIAKQFEMKIQDAPSPKPSSVKEPSAATIKVETKPQMVNKSIK